MRAASNIDVPVGWLVTAAVAIDHNGPIDIAHDPRPADWIARSVFGLFDAVARGQPDAAAIIDPDCTLTYAEVLAGVISLASRIDAAVRPDGAVGVLLPNSAHYPIAVLACLAAGRPSILLDSHFPSARNAGIISDARLAGVIVDNGREHDESVPPGMPRVAFAPCGGDGPSALQAARVDDPDRPAFVIYTSGSTGRPKGLVQSQRIVLRRVGQLIDGKHLGPTDRYLSLASPCTLDGLFDSLAALLSGAALLKIDLRRHGLRDALRFAREKRPTIMLGLPTLLRALAELPEAADSLATLRVVRTSGDALLQADWDLIRDRLPAHCHFLSVYGATEAGAIMQWFIPRDAPPTGTRTPAGYLLPGYRVAILGEDGRPVEPGTVGDLVVSSSYTALGEWRDGRCVEGRLSADPEDPSCRILRTGDLAQLRPDGLFVLLGRRDRQIKIGGLRVEPAEIEAVLRRSPDVRAAVVLPERGERSDVRLLAFIVPAPGSRDRLAGALRTLLESQLPPHMRPSGIVAVDAIPHLPGGKIDVAALMAFAAANIPASVGADAGTSATPASRAMVARVWRGALDAGSLRRDARFDEAGGDSLRLLQLVFRLEQLSGAALPLDRFTADLRPSEFATALDRVKRETAPVAANAAPIFLLPGLSRDEPRLARFRAGCAPDEIVVPVDFGDWSEWLTPGFDFASLCQNVARTIATLAPSGPLRLAGYSIGGRVAFVAAHLLAAAGRTVVFLALLDADALPPRSPAPPAVPRPRRQELHELAVARRQGQACDMAAQIIVRRLTSARWAPILHATARVRRLRWPGRLGFFVDFRLTMALLEELEKSWDRAIADRPMLRAPVVLFRSAGHDPGTPADLGWRQLCGELTVHEVPGDHRTMLLEPNVAALCGAFVRAAGTVSDRAAGSIRQSFMPEREAAE